jgi:outer membrane protein
MPDTIFFKNLLLICVFVLLNYPVNVQAQTKFTLQQAIQTAIRGNLQIRQAKVSEESSAVDKNNTQKTANDITIQIITSFLAVLNYKDQLVAANEQYKTAQIQLDFEFKRFEAGEKTLADLSKARYELAKTQVNITTIQNMLDSSTLALKQLMNIEPDLDITLVQPLDTEFTAARYNSPTIIFASALNTFPEIKNAEFNRLSALKSVDIAKSLYYPVLSFSAALASSYLYEFQYPSFLGFNSKQASYFNQMRNNAYEYVGLNLSIPIFNGFNAKIAIQKAKLSVESATIQEELTKNILYQVISQAISDYNAAEKNYLSAQESFQFSKETFLVIKKRYDAGSSNSFDFEQAQNDMNQAQFTLIDDKYNLIFKAKVLDFYRGKSFLN